MLVQFISMCSLILVNSTIMLDSSDFVRHIITMTVWAVCDTVDTTKVQWNQRYARVDAESSEG